jgi:YD repeat-containing protein
MKSFTSIALTAAIFSMCHGGHVLAAGPDQEPIPSFYQEPGINPNRDTVSHSVNEHIDPFSGKLQWHFTDLSIPGNGGLTLKVQRSYSSRNEDYEPSPLGVGWTMHFGRVLRKASISVCDFSQADPAKNPVLELPDGSRNVMYLALGGGSFITSGRWRGDCDSTGLHVRAPDGTHYDMDVPGPTVGTDPNKTQASLYPSKITDRNGNTISITYTFADGLNFGPQFVTTSDGRSLTFEYLNGTLKSVSDGSRTWSYAVEPIPGIVGGSYLTRATRPDGAAWQYEYNGPGIGPGQGTPGGYSMKKVTYPTGGQINYTYGFVTFNPAPFFPPATVITRKVAGADTWQYTYTPAINPIPTCGATLCPIHPVNDADKMDKTTIAAPDGNSYVHQHLGYTSASAGYVYLIGSLLFKWSGQVQIESNGWGGQVISAQPNQRPGGAYNADAQTSAPLLFQRSVNRANAVFTTQFYDGAAAGFGFDDYGNSGKITEIGPSESGVTETRITTLTYFIDPAKWIIHQKKDETTDTIGTITRTFDPNGNMLSETRYGVPTAYTYTLEGDMASKTDARSNTVFYTSHFRGVARSETHPEDVVISRTVSNAGNVLSETDGEFKTTSFGYDGMNRITSIIHPIGNPVTVAWGANTRTVIRGGFQEVTAFDGFGRRSSVVHSDGTGGTITQTFAYDPIGRKKFASYPNASVGTYFTYSAADHLLTVLHAADATGGGSTSGQGYSYNANTVKLTNERGKDFIYTYRGWGDPGSLELMKITAPEPTASIVMKRNGLGKLTEATQDGRTRTYVYDNRYFLMSTTEPEVGQTVFGRDAIGNMTSRTVGTSPATTFEYDGRNRLKTVLYPLGTPSVTRTYYRDDKTATVDNGTARREFVYDANKNLKQEKLVTGGQTFLVNYDYDGNDALDVMTYGSGKTVTYQPDVLGRPTRAMPYVTSVLHHPTGQIKQMKYANGVQTDIDLNPRNWPSKQVIAKGVRYFDTSYGYEGNGNVTMITDDVDSSYFRSMSYDGVDRLANINGPWGSGLFSYDGRGNIQGQTLGSSFSMGYTYDGASDRLLSTTGTKVYAFAYDVYGNVTANGFTSFGYNDASQMRCARCGQPNEIAYEYDGLGLRTKVQQSGSATYFIYDANGRLLWERNPDGSIKEYVYLGGHQVAARVQAPAP